MTLHFASLHNTCATALVCLSTIVAAQLHSASATERPCEGAIPCELGNRSYHVQPPDNWDGKTPLPVLLHFHGWGRQGTLIVKHGRIAGATRKLGVLLVAPNGDGRSWDFWTSDTDDVDFAAKVINDVAKNYPVDRSKIFVSGYSYGSAMAWRFACSGAANITALLAVSGTLSDQSEDCASPVHVRHVHGTSDTVMDYPFGPSGEVEYAVSLWRDRNGCGDAPSNRNTWQAVKILPFTRLTWSGCQSGKDVILDVHKRGHFIPRFWIETQLRELL